MTRTYRYVSLIVTIILCFAIAAFGAVFKPDAWFEALNKPTWMPPDAVFAPVWTVLYTFIAFSLWQLWLSDRKNQVIVFFVLQLLFNGLWSWLFFGLHQPVAALIDIILLVITLSFTIRLAWPLNRLATYLLLPYLAWVIFASFLNGAIVILN